MGLYRIRANFFVWGIETIEYIFIDKYLGGGRSAVALIRVLWIVVCFRLWLGIGFTCLWHWRCFLWPMCCSG